MHYADAGPCPAASSSTHASIGIRFRCSRLSGVDRQAATIWGRTDAVVPLPPVIEKK